MKQEVACLPNGYFKHLETINNTLFTSREIDIISCVIHMRGNCKIASILGISPRTIETHIVNIKRKIENNGREGIIDFIEKSEQLPLVRKHYQNLLIKADFNKNLKSISNLIHTNSSCCYFFCSNKKNKNSILSFIQNHLKIAGIKLKVHPLNELFFDFKPDAHFIFVLSNNNNNTSIISKALQEYKNKPNLFTFIVTDNFNPELAEIPFIDLSNCKNYYLTIINILKKLAPEVNFDSTVTHLNQYHKSVTDHQGLVIDDKNFKIEKNITNSVNSLLNILVSKKLTIISCILIIIIIGIKMLNQEKKKVDHHLLITYTMTSYVPEILTGHELFVGRKKELQQIESFLNKKNMVIISGQAGVGKSACAIEFGKLHKKYRIVRYFNAEMISKVEQQYRELAEEFNIKLDQHPKTVIMQLVNNKINSIATEFLFIFDNVDIYEDIKEYLTNLPNNVQTIITTRQPMLITNIPHVYLAEFNNEEATFYLKNSLRDRKLTNELISKIAKNNSLLPYDLKCIAAYLLDNPCINNKTIAEEISSKIKNKLFEEFMNSSNPVKQHSWKTLQYIAYLDPDFIDINIIQQLFPQEIELSSAVLKKLESLSLISIINNQHDQTGLKIHRKLQKNILNSMCNYPNYSIKKSFLIYHLLSVINKSFPTVSFNHSDNWFEASNLHYTTPQF